MVVDDTDSASQDSSRARSLEEVLNRFLNSAGVLPDESVSLLEGVGRFLALPPVARVPNPMWDSVGLDGFAIRAGDAKQSGTVLRVVGRGFPGRPFNGRMESGEAVVVATGAPLPQGTDAVVPLEETEPFPGDPTRIRLLRRVRPWQSVRFRGEDISEGQALLMPGQRMGPGCLALLAAAGIRSVKVHRRPRVGILPTGSELAPPGQPPGPGQVFDGNSPMLESLLSMFGADVRVLPGVPDDPEALDAVFRAALPSLDLLVTTGGASVGEPDLVRPALRRIGAAVHDGTVAIKPGKPFFWARREDRLVAGLPGNPASAWVTALLLVVPVIRRLSGARDVHLPTVPGVLAEPLSNPGDRRQFFRVVMDREGAVRLAGIQASHHITALAHANGLVDQPAGLYWPVGTPVRVIRWGLLE
jgi:molybdopterin molybdotransferase